MKNIIFALTEFRFASPNDSLTFRNDLPNTPFYDIQNRLLSVWSN